MIGARLMAATRLPTPVVWDKYQHDGRWHADASVLIPDGPGSVRWTSVITSDARTRIGRELHVIRGRLLIRWTALQAHAAARRAARRGNLDRP